VTNNGAGIIGPLFVWKKSQITTHSFIHTNNWRQIRLVSHRQYTNRLTYWLKIMALEKGQKYRQPECQVERPSSVQ